ncbi:hypothetical protein IMZ11_04755 [Microtetraspora sp. AC03309]|uniref:hypothetical protein n=1 Tax=Microtetraspora sp. AC03309 TaxID=2779376 RepID=UPI001E55E0C8|nr:hypothetical protein [Microtetraspora sp. AC03309]MCC5574948.1 hypothetical protein [Microtetraspora sp. AC03309]
MERVPSGSGPEPVAVVGAVLAQPGSGAVGGGPFLVQRGRVPGDREPAHVLHDKGGSALGDFSLRSIHPCAPAP